MSSMTPFKLSELQLHNVRRSNQTPQVQTKQRPTVIICGLFAALWKPSSFRGYYSDDQQHYLQKNDSFNYILNEGTIMSTRGTNNSSHKVRHGACWACSCILVLPSVKKVFFFQLQSKKSFKLMLFWPKLNKCSCCFFTWGLIRVFI